MRYLILCTCLLLACTAGFAQPKPDIFQYAEEMPEFDGDMQRYLSSRLMYPADARENDIQGKVIIRFVVNENGDIESVTVAKSVYKSLDEEAMRVIRGMPRWKPGRMKGKPVKVYYTLPINFMLSGDTPRQSADTTGNRQQPGDADTGGSLMQFFNSQEERNLYAAAASHITDLQLDSVWSVYTRIRQLNPKNPFNYLLSGTVYNLRQEYGKAFTELETGYRILHTADTAHQFADQQNIFVMQMLWSANMGGDYSQALRFFGDSTTALSKDKFRKYATELKALQAMDKLSNKELERKIKSKHFDNRDNMDAVLLLASRNIRASKHMNAFLLLAVAQHSNDQSRYREMLPLIAGSYMQFIPLIGDMRTTVAATDRDFLQLFATKRSVLQRRDPESYIRNVIKGYNDWAQANPKDFYAAYFGSLIAAVQAKSLQKEFLRSAIADFENASRKTDEGYKSLLQQWAEQP